MPRTIIKWVAHHLVLTAAFVIGSGLLVGGTAFSIMENVRWIDGLWWAFVSMTTVGYGDIAPKTTEIRMLATFVIGSGIAATAILTGALAGASAELRLTSANKTPELHDDIDDLIGQLEAMRAVLKDQRVVSVLREIHEERV